MIDIDELEDEELDIEIELRARELARRNYLDFVEYVKPKYQAEFFHRTIAEHLQQFEEGTIKKLMITMPPQHGKSELSTRNFPAYLLGKKPNRRIGVLSYSASKAHKFSREIQQVFDGGRYSAVFPKSRLAGSKDYGAKRTEQEFDIVGTGGSVKAVGRKGPLTGDPIDIAILDDLFKDSDEAKSPTVRESTWAWIVDVVETRFHNDSQILYVTTRWDEDDPAGRFLKRDGIYDAKRNPDGWVLLNFAALRTNAVLSYDPRSEGEALWPKRHSKRRLEKVKRDSKNTFNALYQGDPKPDSEIIIFSDWIEIDEFPSQFDDEFVGLDFGYTNDPTAATHIGIEGNSIYLDELFYETHLTNQDILDHYQATGLPNHLQVVCDHAEPKSIEELARGYWKEGKEFVPGINAIACIKGDGSIRAGISKLKTYTVYYTSRSVNLKNEVGKYAWKVFAGKITNDPIDDYNHALDGIRSAVFTLKTKPKGGTGKMKTYKAQTGRNW